MSWFSRQARPHAGYAPVPSDCEIADRTEPLGERISSRDMAAQEENEQEAPPNPSSPQNEVRFQSKTTTNATTPRHATSLSERQMSKRKMTFTEHLFSSEKHPEYILLPGGQAIKTWEDPIERFSCVPVLDPQASAYSEKWDIIMTTALLVTALWTPYEVAFIDRGEMQPGKLIFFVDRALDIVFVKDMVIQFVTSYPEEREGTVRWVRDRTKIVSHYLSGWFWTDLIATMPLDLIVEAACIENNQALRTVKVVRLARLFRLMKVGRIVKKWQAAWGVSYGQVDLMKFFFGTVMAVHWMSCMWGLLALSAQEAANPDARTWLTGLFEGKKMSDEEREFYSKPQRVYIISLYWAVMTLTSLGYGDIVAENINEYAFCVCCFVTSGLIWAYVIGSICGIISAMDPLLIQYQQNMDLLNIMMVDNNLPEDMRRRMRDYFQESRVLQRKNNQHTVVSTLSPGLQGELAVRLAQDSLHRVWYLRPMLESETEPVIEISKRLKPMIFASQETMGLNNASRTLFIVCRGVVAMDGMILNRHCTVGDDMIISNSMLRSAGRAISVTFTEVLFLRNEQLDEIREAFPATEEKLRRVQIRWALRRGFVLAAWRRVQAENVAGPRTTDFFRQEVPSFTTKETAEAWGSITTPRGSLLGNAVGMRRVSVVAGVAKLQRRNSILGGGAGGGGTRNNRTGGSPRNGSLSPGAGRRSSFGGKPRGQAPLGGSPGFGDAGFGSEQGTRPVLEALEMMQRELVETMGRMEARLERVERRVNPGFLD